MDIMDDSRAYNQAFIEILKQDGPVKAAAALTEYVRMEIREESFARRILGSQPITPLELDKQEKGDTPIKIVELEPDSQAYALTFDGKPPERWFKGSSYTVYFAHYRTEAWRGTEGKLATYKSPIKKIIHDNQLLDIAKREDKTLIDGVEVIIAATGKSYSATGGWTATEFAKGCKQITKDKLRVGGVLMNESNYNEMAAWPATQVGGKRATESHESGWTHKDLMGKGLITTVKEDLIPDGTIYFFAAPEYLGKHYVLNDLRVYFEHKGPDIMFFTWADIGMGIGNTKAVAKMTWTP